ncbi:MAG: mechanosensitive ion channel family protein [Acidobacteriales bacterium]|nr:mechanosensitive ion channel family protein [Terriglobales bacterium]
MQVDWNAFTQNALTVLVAVGVKVIEAIVLWMVGRWLINLSLRLISRAMTRQAIDPTLIRYVNNAVNALLNIALVVAILGFFGVETTTFAALVAGAGVAIGLAWSGLLGNFASGVFLVILQPFRVGDFVTIGGITGTVHEIGLFATSLDTPDNVRTIIGNGKIFADTIQNFSHNAYRRVELTAQLAHGVDPNAAMAMLKQGMAQIPNVLAASAPDAEILTFNLAGPVLAVRPYCHNRDYWQVYFDTNRLIRDSFTQSGYPVPEQHYSIHNEEDSRAARAVA